MKFRYAAAVQRSLIEHRALLDVSLKLTRINCDIEEMRRVDVRRRPAQAGEIEQMMQQHAFEAARCKRWRAYLDGPLA